jgi:Non-classical export protein 1
MASPVYLISKVADPIFALFIGLSAAATRINREEKELGRTTKQTIDAGFRYGDLFPHSEIFGANKSKGD